MTGENSSRLFYSACFGHEMGREGSLCKRFFSVLSMYRRGGMNVRTQDEIRNTKERLLITCHDDTETWFTISFNLVTIQHTFSSHPRFT